MFVGNWGSAPNPGAASLQESYKHGGYGYTKDVIQYMRLFRYRKMLLFKVPERRNNNRNLGNVFLPKIYHYTGTKFANFACSFHELGTTGIQQSSMF